MGSISKTCQKKGCTSTVTLKSQSIQFDHKNQYRKKCNKGHENKFKLASLIKYPELIDVPAIHAATQEVNQNYPWC